MASSSVSLEFHMRQNLLSRRKTKRKNELYVKLDVMISVCFSLPSLLDYSNIHCYPLPEICLFLPSTHKAQMVACHHATPSNERTPQEVLPISRASLYQSLLPPLSPFALVCVRSQLYPALQPHGL